jgi:hypothetical protein
MSLPTSLAIDTAHLDISTFQSGTLAFPFQCKQVSSLSSSSLSTLQSTSDSAAIAIVAIDRLSSNGNNDTSSVGAVVSTTTSIPSTIEWNRWNGHQLWAMYFNEIVSWDVNHSSTSARGSAMKPLWSVAVDSCAAMSTSDDGNTCMVAVNGNGSSECHTIDSRTSSIVSSIDSALVPAQPYSIYQSAHHVMIGGQSQPRYAGWQDEHHGHGRYCMFDTRRPASPLFSIHAQSVLFDASTCLLAALISPPYFEGLRLYDYRRFSSSTVDSPLDLELLSDRNGHVHATISGFRRPIIMDHERLISSSHSTDINGEIRLSVIDMVPSSFISSIQRQSSAWKPTIPK